MSIEAIAAVAPSGALFQTIGTQAATAAPALTTTSLAPPPELNALGADTGLFDRLVSQLGEIDAGMQAGSRNATELALGQSDNLHQTMIAGERTRLQFDLMMSMRSRVLEAYQEIMRMQV